MMIDFATTDLCDAHEDLRASAVLRVVPVSLLAFGRRRRFAGPAATLRLFEDNSLLAEAVNSAGLGRVLVVDAGASTRCAVIGGNLAAAATANGWAGVLVARAVRDADEIDACAIGIRALALCPCRSVKRGQGERAVTIDFLGVRVAPGDWVYADRDGVLIADRALHSGALTALDGVAAGREACDFHDSAAVAYRKTSLVLRSNGRVYERDSNSDA